MQIFLVAQVRQVAADILLGIGVPDVRQHALLVAWFIHRQALQLIHQTVKRFLAAKRISHINAFFGCTADAVGDFFNHGASQLAGNAFLAGAVHRDGHWVLGYFAGDLQRGVAIFIGAHLEAAVRHQRGHHIQHSAMLHIHLQQCFLLLWRDVRIVQGNAAIHQAGAGKLTGTLACSSIGVHPINLAILVHVHGGITNEETSFGCSPDESTQLRWRVSSGKHGHSTCWAVGHTVSFDVEPGLEVLAASFVGHAVACTVNENVDQLIGQAIICLGCSSLQQWNQGAACNVLVALKSLGNGVNSSNHLRLSKQRISLGRNVLWLHRVHTGTSHLQRSRIPQQLLIRVGQIRFRLHGGKCLTHSLVRLWVVPATHHRTCSGDRLIAVIDGQLINSNTTSFGLSSHLGNHILHLVPPTHDSGVLAFSRLTCGHVHGVIHGSAQQVNHVLVCEQGVNLHEWGVEREPRLLLTLLSLLLSWTQWHRTVLLHVTHGNISRIEIDHIISRNTQQSGQHRRDGFLAFFQFAWQVTADQLLTFWGSTSTQLVRILDHFNDIATGGVHQNVHPFKELLREVALAVLTMNHGIEQLSRHGVNHSLGLGNRSIVLDAQIPRLGDCVSNPTDCIFVIHAL